MSSKSVAQKLLIKAGNKILVINPPEGYRELLGALPDGVNELSELEGEFDLIQIFLTSVEEMEAWLHKLREQLNADGKLWVTYPKGTSKKYTSEVNRDSLYAYASTVGLRGVAMIAVDEDWSAMRFKLV